MPHRTFVQVAKRRLVGKEGPMRVRVLRSLIEVWGPSVRFDGQRVGRAHIVADLDEVEIVH